MKSRISRRSFVQSVAASVIPAALVPGKSGIAKALASLGGGAQAASGNVAWKDAGVVDVCAPHLPS